MSPPPRPKVGIAPQLSDEQLITLGRIVERSAALEHVAVRLVVHALGGSHEALIAAWGQTFGASRKTFLRLAALPGRPAWYDQAKEWFTSAGKAVDARNIAVHSATFLGIVGEDGDVSPLNVPQRRGHAYAALTKQHQDVLVLLDEACQDIGTLMYLCLGGPKRSALTMAVDQENVPPSVRNATH